MCVGDSRIMSDQTLMNRITEASESRKTDRKNGKADWPTLEELLLELLWWRSWREQSEK